MMRVYRLLEPLFTDYGTEIIYFVYISPISLRLSENPGIGKNPEKEISFIKHISDSLSSILNFLSKNREKLKKSISRKPSFNVTEEILLLNKLTNDYCRTLVQLKGSYKVIICLKCFSFCDSEPSLQRQSLFPKMLKSKFNLHV